MSSWRQASATSGSSTGVTTKDAPASFASRTAPGSHTVPTPTGYRPMVVAINPRIISKHEGTVLVTSIVMTPPSMAERQAWKPASALFVRSTPQTRLGKTSATVRIDLESSRRREAPTTMRGDGGRTVGAPAELVGGRHSFFLQRDVPSDRRDDLAHLHGHAGRMARGGGRRSARLSRTGYRGTDTADPHARWVSLPRRVEGPVRAMERGSTLRTRRSTAWRLLAAGRSSAHA